MKLDRQDNINTQSYWNHRYHTIVNTTPAMKAMDNFFKFGFLPTDEEFTVLEIGCGTTTNYPEIHRRYPKAKITGADLSNFAYNHNVKNYPFAKFSCLDIERDPLPETYDYIISNHTFEHLTNPVRALNKCLRHARKNVIICVPYKESWSYDHEHMHTFSETEPFDTHDYYLIEYYVPHKVGGIYFQFKGQAK